MSIFKKIISLTLMFLLVFSCLPTAAFADETETETEVTEEAVVEKSAAAFSVEDRRWTDAETTEEAVRLSGLSQPYGREILSGTPEQGEQ